jgi:glycine/D-amino acid oxidase-like deaminating enzyme
VQTDYIIIGQGICGTLLSYFLQKGGKRVVMVDDREPGASSRVASGLMNPVTGKRIVQSWMIDELMPFAVKTYRELEKELEVTLLSQTNVLEFFASREEQEVFRKRVEEGNKYLNEQDAAGTVGFFRYNYGVGEIHPCYLLNLQALLPAWRERLRSSGMLIEEIFDARRLLVERDTVRYKDIQAKSVIFCTGTRSFQNTWFANLPYSTNKGEALIARIEGLPRTNVYKYGIKIAPWQDDLFWIGASFEWKYDDLSVSTAYRKKVEDILQYCLKLPYEIVEHLVSERPSTVDYKPFVGFHPLVPQVGIFNGMGSKGCTQAPYFASMFAEHILSGTALQPDVDIKRFARILSR